MRTLRRSECSVLSLVMAYPWYDMIDRGEKLEEYREQTRYYASRIMKWTGRFIRDPKCRHLVLAFQRGYSKPSMWFELNLGSFFPREGVEHPEWGEWEERHFVFALGERINLED